MTQCNSENMQLLKMHYAERIFCYQQNYSGTADSNNYRFSVNCKLVTMSGLQSLEQVNQFFFKLYFSQDLKLVALLTADLKSFVSRKT